MAILVKPSDTKVPDQVADGVHRAVLSNIKEFENAYGPRLGFEFTLQGDGQVVMRSTGPNLTTKSKLAEILRGLLGRDLTDREVNQGFDIEALVGTECNVLLRQGRGKSGNTFSNVEQVFQ